MKKRKKRGLWGVVSMLLGFVCALILGVLFYGAMVYQLAGEAKTPEASNAPALLALDAALKSEEKRQETVGGALCNVVIRSYGLEDGTLMQAISAAPDIYLERLTQEGYIPQLVTGYTLAGLDAVCQAKGDMLLLAARRAGNAYLLLGETDEQTLYALGMTARLEETAPQHGAQARVSN